MLERLIVRAELSAFERGLRERLERVATLDDERVQKPRSIERTAAKGGPKDVRHDIENSGMGFRTDAKIDGWMSAQPTSCQMKRP